MAAVTGLLSLAMPPIPGGALTCFTVMNAQLGIPVEALALTITVNSDEQLHRHGDRLDLFAGRSHGNRRPAGDAESEPP